MVRQPLPASPAKAAFSKHTAVTISQAVLHRPQELATPRLRGASKQRHDNCVSRSLHLGTPELRSSRQLARGWCRAQVAAARHPLQQQGWLLACCWPEFGKWRIKWIWIKDLSKTNLKDEDKRSFKEGTILPAEWKREQDKLQCAPLKKSVYSGTPTNFKTNHEAGCSTSHTCNYFICKGCSEAFHSFKDILKVGQKTRFVIKKSITQQTRDLSDPLTSEQN